MCPRRRPSNPAGRCRQTRHKKYSPWLLPRSECREDARGSTAGPFLDAGDVGVDAHRWRRRRRLRFAIDQLFEFLARLEVRHLFWRHIHFVAGLRVAPFARLTTSQTKASKSAQFDLLAAMQRVDDALEHGVDDHLGM